MKYLKRGFSQTIKSIKERKGLFVLLVVLQLILVVSVIGVSIYFQVKIFADARGIIEPLQNANYDADSIEEGTPFSEEIINIYQSYISMKRNVIVFVTWLFFLFILLNNSIWILTHALLRNINLKNYKKMFHAWLKLTASVLLILGPFLLVSYYLLISMLRMEAAESFSNIANILQYTLLALYYFILVAFAAVHYSSWKRFAEVFYRTSVLKIFKSLAVLLINSAIIFLFGYGVYVIVNNENSFLSLVLISLLFIISLVFTRIFWIASLREISYEKNNH